MFDEEGALGRLEAFASENGPNFYGLPLNEGTITLERVGHRVPDTIAGGAGQEPVVPFHAGQELNWRLA